VRVRFDTSGGRLSKGLHISIFSPDTLFSLSRRLLFCFIFLQNAELPDIPYSANMIIMSLPMSRVPIDPATCRIWFIFLFASCAMLSAALDFILMLRVYALYQRSLKVASLLLTLFSVQTIAATIAGHSSIRHKTFNETCDLNGTPYESAFLGAAVIATQSVIWSMTLAKRTLVIRQSTPLVGLIYQDGNYVFITICAMVVCALPYSFGANMARAHVIFIWPQAFFSIAACRIIINMQRQQRNDSPNTPLSKTSIHLSTHINVSTTLDTSVPVLLR